MTTRRLLTVPLLAALATTGLVAMPAQAASHTISLGAIARTGAPIGVTGSLVSLSSTKRYTVATGRAAKVPAGRYALVAVITESPAKTLAARVLDVKANGAVTFDARQGKPVSFRVDDPTARQTALAVKISAGKKAVLSPEFLPADATYAIPTASKDLKFAVHSVLANTAAAETSYRYDLVKTTTGIPSKLPFSTTRKKLAKVTMSLGVLDPDQQVALRLSPRKADSTLVVTHDGPWVEHPPAAALTSYRTPDLVWRTDLFVSGAHGTASLAMQAPVKNNRLVRYAAGKSYREDWGGGVWAVTPESVNIAVDRRTLEVGGRSPICAPSTGAVRVDSCELTPVSVTYSLFSGGKLLMSGTNIKYRIPTARKTYVVEMVARRPEGAGRSAVVTARWSFKADGTFNGVRPAEAGRIRLVPAGMDLRGLVKAGALTKITMGVEELASVKSAKLEYSTDGGATWRTVPVTKSGSSWRANVPAPASGWVSLRATAKSKSGASVVQTVTNAYGVR